MPLDSPGSWIDIPISPIVSAATRWCWRDLRYQDEAAASWMLDVVEGICLECYLNEAIKLQE